MKTEKNHSMDLMDRNVTFLIKKSATARFLPHRQNISLVIVSYHDTFFLSIPYRITDHK